MKKTIYALLAALVLLAAASQAFGSVGVKWVSLKEGMERAKSEKKPMIVDFFFGKGCPRCEQLEKGVYSNQAIAKKIMDDFIPIRVDLTKELTKEEEKLGEKYDYKKDCLLLFLDSGGNIVKDPSGKRLCFADNVDEEWFIKYLDMVKKQQK
jgi:thioredoxin-related protein